MATTTDTSGDQRVRRLSSMDASRADLYGGPSVVLPPKHLMATADAHETAITMELARQRLEDEVSSDDASTRMTTPLQRPAVTTTDEFALAFDIDGVLIRGGNPIPAAVKAMKYINGENPYGIKV